MAPTFEISSAGAATPTAHGAEAGAEAEAGVEAGAGAGAGAEITRRAGIRAGLCGTQLHRLRQDERAGLWSMLGRPRLLSVIGLDPLRAWQPHSSQRSLCSPRSPA